MQMDFSQQAVAAVAVAASSRKRQELKALVNSFKDHPHVFAVTEVKPKNMSQQLLVSEFNLQGYKSSVKV